MPTLHWIGKDKVINHHLDVPYRILKKQYTYNAEASENKIIHGDNLEALKSLLPEYEGSIKCIYIDPPYNTGNEGWVYNDNVNDPKLKKWLGEVVGKESEDLTRHDKWLCMMYPRLKLLHRLLAEDGAIFISIDDNEQANLRLMCDEIFGSNNFVANFIWQHRKSSQNDIDVSLSHNYTFCFAKKRNGYKLNSLPISDSRFSNKDNDPRGSWVADPLDAPNIRPNLEYPIVNPDTQEIFYPPKGRHWRFTKEKYEEALLDNRILFGKTGKSKPQYKRFLYEAQSKGTNPFTIWTELGTATNATKELIEIFDGNKLFQTPKPMSLLKRIFELATDKDSIILDSFAGSGTTAHAVLNLNKQDGGNRKFILVEMEDYADNITAERVKRVINGYGEGKSVEGTGGDFSYYELGQPMFIENDYLNEELPLQEIHRYIWYTETARPFDESQKEHSHLLGVNDNASYYFFYERDHLTTLNHEFLQTIKQKSNTYVIYADNCVLPKEFMAKNNIIFKKIPRDITRF